MCRVGIYGKKALTEAGKQDEDFSIKYRELEERMMALADADGDVFLPNPEPPGPVDYVFIGMEPSLGGSSPKAVKAEVEAGARNFVNSIEDFILHFSIRHYLRDDGQRYHITDISKGAMAVDGASTDRDRRWGRWYDLLLEELDLVAKPGADVFAVGKLVEEYLERRSFPIPFTTLIHYSGQNALGRKRCTGSHQVHFEQFKDTIALEDVLATAEQVLGSSVPRRFRDQTLERLRGRQLSESRKRLIFCYKLAFEGRL